MAESIEIADGVFMNDKMYKKLYAYQRNGVCWLAKLFTSNSPGGILADDMGLGKTIQICTFLGTLLESGFIRSVLIVMPKSLITTWEKELSKWCRRCTVRVYGEGSRETDLYRIQRKGGFLLVTYGLVLSSAQQLGTMINKENFSWDYLVLDEGHKIKNANSKTAKCISSIPAKHRLLLTGTAIQNNVTEMWALFNFTHQGELLGSIRTFNSQYGNAIQRALHKDASTHERKLGDMMVESLKKVIEPFFLRRTKAEVGVLNGANGEQRRSLTESNHDSGDTTALEETNANSTDTPPAPSLTRKNDLVVWLYLSEIQESCYREFLNRAEIKEVLMTSRSPLVQLGLLKRICDHPRLLKLRQCVHLELAEVQNINEAELDECAATNINDIADEQLIKESGKFLFLVELLPLLKNEGHRTLIFSQSLRILDMLQRILTNLGFRLLRMDGSVTRNADRQRLIKKFQTDDSYDAFLLTTQVGGVGLTLTGADRVIIYDPSWNPAVDNQAVDRAFRIGQTRDVVVYRLITCSTVEEKIYRRQVFKGSIIRQATNKAIQNTTRYFTKSELRDLFTLENARSSVTQRQLHAMHSAERISDALLDKHIETIESMDSTFGLSDHDRLFSQEEVDDNASKDENDDEIHAMVKRAQKVMEEENETIRKLRDLNIGNESGKYTSQSRQIAKDMTQENKFPNPKSVNPFPSSLTTMSPTESNLPDLFVPKRTDTKHAVAHRLPNKIHSPSNPVADSVVKTEDTSPEQRRLTISPEHRPTVPVDIFTPITKRESIEDGDATNSTPEQRHLDRPTGLIELSESEAEESSLALNHSDASVNDSSSVYDKVIENSILGDSENQFDSSNVIGNFRSHRGRGRIILSSSDEGTVSESDDDDNDVDYEDVEDVKPTVFVSGDNELSRAFQKVPGKLKDEDEPSCSNDDQDYGDVETDKPNLTASRDNKLSADVEDDVEDENDDFEHSHAQNADLLPKCLNKDRSTGNLVSNEIHGRKDVQNIPEKLKIEDNSLSAEPNKSNDYTAEDSMIVPRSVKRSGHRARVIISDSDSD